MFVFKTKQNENSWDGVPGKMKINLYQLNKCYKVLHLRSQKLLYYTNMNHLAAL